MKQKLATHAERVRLRRKINGQAYPDNPERLPYDNDGNLIPRHRLIANAMVPQPSRN